jgi:hypothetical protein
MNELEAALHRAEMDKCEAVDLAEYLRGKLEVTEADRDRWRRDHHEQVRRKRVGRDLMRAHYEEVIDSLMLDLALATDGPSTDEWMAMLERARVSRVYVAESGTYEQRGVHGVYRTLDDAKAEFTNIRGEWRHYEDGDTWAADLIGWPDHVDIRPFDVITDESLLAAEAAP